MEWKIILDLGTVETGKYGTAGNLRAELPLLSGLTYDVPSMVRDRPKVARIGSDLADKFRHRFQKLSEPAVRAKVTVPFLFAIYQNPQLDWDGSPGLRAAVDFMINALALDDVVDKAVKVPNGVGNYRTLLSFLKVLGKTDLDFERFLPLLIDESGPQEPDTENILVSFAVGFEAYNKSMTAVAAHGWDPQVAKYFFEESVLVGTASYFTLAAKAAPSLAFSHVTYNRQILQFLHGMRLAVEQNALLAPGARMPDSIRTTLLFRMLMDSFGNATALINAIVGLRRDIAEDAWEDTPILRHVVQKGWSLEQSFENAVDAFKSEVKDMQLMLTILEETHDEEEGVEEFLNVFEHSFMGTCLMYTDESARDRYAVQSVEVVKTNSYELFMKTPKSNGCHAVASTSEIQDDFIRVTEH